jgi:hypothetical protein
VPPTVIGVVGAETVTDATGARVTVIEDVPVLPSLVAVIVTGPPADTAVTRPLPSTVAPPVLFELQLTALPESRLPLASLRVALSCWVGVIPRTSPTVAGLTVTEATGTGFTVTAAVGVEVTDSLVAVIVAEPTPTAVTVAGDPLALTVNTEVLLDTQVTVRPLRRLPLASLVVAVIC